MTKAVGKGRAAKGRPEKRSRALSLPNAKPAKKKPAAAAPEKTTPEVTPARVLTFLRSRFNPIRHLTPDLLTHYMDRFKLGWMRELGLIWDQIQERDDKVKLVSGLSSKGVARYEHQIEVIDDLQASDKSRAEEHKAALEYFYGNLTTVTTIDENERGSVRKLIEQMMDAKGKRYSVHEIVWQPQDDGSLTAEFRWVPIWFFENTTGKLRYVPVEGGADGVDLEDGGWMVTVGDGLMYATSIAYIFKTWPLRDWVTYCERNGMPGFIGKTNAPQGSAQWIAMEAAVEALASDFAAVMSTSESVDVLDLKGSQANQPYEPLVRRMDSAISALWRGGDLSTMSSGQHSQGHGSNRQEDEAEILLDADVAMIEETLRINVDRHVIQNVFGNELPLARFSIVVPPKEATAQDLTIDQGLVEMGVPLGVDDAYKRYGRVPPRAGEALLTAPAQPEQLPAGLGNEAQMARIIVNAKPDVAAALAKTFRPVREHYLQALDVPDDQLQGSLDRFRAALPDLLREMDVNQELVGAVGNTYAAAILDGLTSNAKTK